MIRKLFAVFIFLLTSIQSYANNTGFEVGNTKIYYSVPSEFIDGESIPDKFRKPLEASTSENMTLQAYFLPESDVKQRLLGVPVTLDKIIYINTSKQDDLRNINFLEFDDVKKEVRKIYPRIFDEQRIGIENLASEAFEELNLNIELNISGSVSLGIYADDPNAIGFVNLINRSYEIDGKPISDIRVFSSSIVHVQGKLLYVHVFSGYESSGDIDWVKHTSEEFIKNIIARNQQRT